MAGLVYRPCTFPRFPREIFAVTPDSFVNQDLPPHANVLGAGHAYRNNTCTLECQP